MATNSRYFGKVAKHFVASLKGRRVSRDTKSQKLMFDVSLKGNHSVSVCIKIFDRISNPQVKVLITMVLKYGGAPIEPVSYWDEDHSLVSMLSYSELMRSWSRELSGLTIIKMPS